MFTQFSNFERALGKIKIAAQTFETFFNIFLRFLEF